eukprot:gene48443-10017_t
MDARPWVIRGCLATLTAWGAVRSVEDCLHFGLWRFPIDTGLIPKPYYNGRKPDTFGMVVF